MPIEDVLYGIGEAVDSGVGKLRGLLLPAPSEKPPSFRHLRRLIRRNLTVHEFLSLTLQLAFVSYLMINLILLLLRLDVLWILLIAPPYFLYIRYILVRNRRFFLEPDLYRVFYYWISIISFASFTGYAVVRDISTTVYYYIGYLTAILGVVVVFRYYFKSRYGRDYTYGVVEEVKNDLVRVFVHDDIAANVKPGYYWLPAISDAEPGSVVKILVEEKALKSARPTRIIEVYLDQSSQRETEPKAATE
ncbi:DUF2101 family protein [Thermococcus sp.]|uniref:DUF2101 family protein n=1 Tax=Thermococcus sp. TaxID=35749 RepID=UPI00261EA2E2|nr:DUF2101 family protein [Thermococcus sp.]